MGSAGIHGVAYVDFVLSPGEHIVECHGRAGDVIDMVGFKTDFGREQTFGNSKGGHKFKLWAQNHVIKGFKVGFGGHLHCIGAHFSQEAGHGGHKFKDKKHKKHGHHGHKHHGGAFPTPQPVPVPVPTVVPGGMPAPMPVPVPVPGMPMPVPGMPAPSAGAGGVPTYTPPGGVPGYPAGTPGVPGYPAGTPGVPGYPAGTPGVPGYPAGTPAPVPAPVPAPGVPAGFPAPVPAPVPGYPAGAPAPGYPAGTPGIPAPAPVTPVYPPGTGVTPAPGYPAGAPAPGYPAGTPGVMPTPAPAPVPVPVPVASSPSISEIAGKAGGLNAKAFDDWSTHLATKANIRICNVRVFHDTGSVKGLQVQYEADGQVLLGGSHVSEAPFASTPSDVTLQYGEYITGISGNAGLWINSITISTSLGNQHTFGGSGMGQYNFMIPAGRQVIAFKGSTNLHLEHL